MPNAAIMLCAGRATRMRGAVADKVLAPLAGQTVLEHSLKTFREAKVADYFVFVIRDEAQRVAVSKILLKLGGRFDKIRFATGGKERQDSVYNGLLAVPEGVDHVFIHDCARPLVTVKNLRALATAVKKDRAAVLAHRVVDTIKQTPLKTGPKLSPLKLRDLPRDTLWAMETPQAFARELILTAYKKVRAKKVRVTDDVAAASLLGHKITLVENSSPNPKLTHPEDFAWVELLFAKKL
jgi:2-C-methyl-D-erythritol 4-phosphate cytidylyltransferase